MSWRAHDLLRVRRDRLLPAGVAALPDWVVAGSGPVVVRRARAVAGQIAVGVRGQDKSERCAAFAPLDAIEQGIDPFGLCAKRSWIDHPQRGLHPVLVTLERLAPVLDEWGLRWGVTGSLGYEFATGDPQIGPASDLDLVLDAPRPVSRQQAACLLQRLHPCSCRVDIQLETPRGAIALTEWAGPSPRVLQKTQAGPRLTATPWEPDQDGGQLPC